MNMKTATSLAAGIYMGQRMVGHERGDACLAGQYGIIEQHRTLVGPNGETLAPSTPSRRARDLAYAEGFIAAYRAATEF